MPSNLEDIVAKMLGNLGMPDVRVGSHVIKAKRPKSDESLEGYGDTVHVGDFVRTQRVSAGAPESMLDEICRVEALRRDEACPQVQLFPINNLECVHSYPLMQYVRYPDFPQDGIDFVLVTQEQVDEWWERRRFGPGWHHLDKPIDSVRVLIGDDGTPLKLDRGYDRRNVNESRRWAEVSTGYDLEISARYEDSRKLIRTIKRATRRPPPKVPR
jgi:hypothetical protein